MTFYAERVGEAQEGILEHRHLDPIRDGASVLLGVNETRRLEDGEVGGHSGLGDVEVLGELAGGHRPAAEELEYGAPGRVGEGFEDGAH